MPAVRVLTQNCCLLPSYLHQSSGADNRPQRAQLIKQMVQRYDIVLLQEVLGTRWCQRWRELFQAMPTMHTVMSTRAPLKLVDSGLVILSHYPVLDSTFVRFRSKSLSNAVVDRGFLYAKIDVHGSHVHVVNTHLNPSECNYGIHSPAEYRRRQMREILAFKAAQAADGDVWIIGGDYNEPNIRSLVPEGMAISVTDQDTSHARVPFAIDGSPNECIDYLVTNRPQKYSLVLENLVSDHYGVEAVVEW